MADPQSGWTPVDESAWTLVRSANPTETLSQHLRVSSGSEEPDAAPSGHLADLNRSLMGSAYPQSAGDFASLLIPAGISTAIGAAKAYGAAAKEAWAANPSLKQLPVGMFKALARKATGPRPIVGFERYGGMEPSSFKSGDVTPPSLAEALPGLTSSRPSAPIVDEAGASLGGYAGPERRVSGAAARAAWSDRAHANLLERLGGRGTPPSAAEVELAQKLGQPGDAEVAMAVSHRNAAGNWARPPASATGPKTLNEAMDAAVKAQRLREELVAQLANK